MYNGQSAIISRIKGIFYSKMKEEDLYETESKEKGHYFIARGTYTYHSYWIYRNKI